MNTRNGKKRQGDGPRYTINRKGDVVKSHKKTTNTRAAEREALRRSNAAKMHAVHAAAVKGGQ